MQNPISSFFFLPQGFCSVLAVTAMQKISRNVDESTAYIKVWGTEGRGVSEAIWGNALP